ncbi:MAG: DoxX family membrane protein, partial [Ktedonobacteraceae bacterium]|nr:DoxX family membrane protein [Ktedonobacteraceae bacterium]
PVIAALEVIGGVGLMLGVGTQLLAFLLACDMLVAVVLVSVKQGFGGGSEFELALLAGLVALVLGGAGPFTVLRPRKEVSRPQKEPIVPGAFATPRK